MTVIAAIASDGHVVMGCDVAATNNSTIMHKAEGKIITVPIKGTDDHVLLGAAGSAGLLPLIRRNLKLDTTPGDDVDDWANSIASDVTGIAHSATPPMIVNYDDDAPGIDGYLLMAYRGYVWNLITHAALRPESGIIAIGSGQDIALGAMYAAMGLDAEPEDAVTLAVGLAGHLNDGCAVDDRGPLVYHT